MTYTLLILMLIIVAAGLCGIVILMMALHMLNPPRMTEGKAMYMLGRVDPSDLGLAYEKRDFTIQDQATGKPMKIAGWWIPAKIPVSQTVILLHGYSDAKVGGIAWAPMWQSLGWNVLAIDQRAHGESDGANSTAGYFEQNDLNQIIDEFKATHPQAASRIAIFGVSLGATVAAAVGSARDDLYAIYMESPYSDYESAIIRHGQRLGMPIEWAFPIAMRLAEKISGAQFDQVKPVDLIPKIKSPLLVIHAGKDTFVPHEQIDQIRQAIAQRDPVLISVHQIIAESEHTLGLASDPDAYQQMVRDFLNKIENRA